MSPWMLDRHEAVFVGLLESRTKAWGSERYASMKRLMSAVFKRSGSVKVRADGVRVRS